MDLTADASTLPVDFEGSLDPSRLPDITLGNHTLMSGQTSPTMGRAGGDRLSPVRGRTMKEYDQQISDLKKENFSLKMRIYYMEERMQQRFGDGQDVFKTNIELQVEIDNLKRDLADKQVLVQKAALAMETLTAKYEQGEEAIRIRLLADYKKDMIQMREQLDKANQQCERSYNDAENAERKVQVLKQQLNDARTELADSRRTNEELSSKVNSAEFGAQTLAGQLRLAEHGREKVEKENQALMQKLKGLEDQLHDACNQSVRKDRDIQNLSTMLQEQTHVDCTSILEPLHIQDELEDYKVAGARKDEQIANLEDKLKDREDAIEGLKNAVKDLEEKQKEDEKMIETTKNELKQRAATLTRCQKSVEGLVKSVYLKDKECKDLKKKLIDAENEVEALQESLREMEIQKTKALDNLTNQLEEADASVRRLKHQLAEANDTSENLVKSLGKKEGELAGFQDQLGKAIDALNKSEEAVENLHSQLKKERDEFEGRLREQAVHFQVSVSNKSEPNNELEGLRQQIVDLQKLIANQNVELLGLARERHAMGDVRDRLKEKDSDIELLSSEHKRELSELEQELRGLRSVINNQEIKIQALEDHKVWLEDNHRETVQRMRETWSSVGGISVRDLSLDLLQDIKMLMNLLRREISSLATLQLQLRELNTPGHGLGTEVLMTEVSSVQRIYKRLEEAVEKNGRLHQVLLTSLRGDQRLSDSPDSNSCQDGGYSLGSPVSQAKQARLSPSPDDTQNDPKTQQKCGKSGKAVVQSESLSSLDSEWESPPGFHSVAVETCPELVDRSLQTGTSFSQIDQYAQTSPRVGDGVNEVGIMTNRGLDVEQQVHETMLIPNVPVNNRSLQVIDSDSDIRRYIYGHHNDSLTDDAKEEHLGLYAESLEDYHNFQHGVFFDERRVDLHSDQSFSKSDHGRMSSPGGKILVLPANTNSYLESRSSGRSTLGDAINTDFIRNGDMSSNSYLESISTGRSTLGDEINTDFIRNGDTSANSNVGCKSGGRSTPGDAKNTDFIRNGDTSTNSNVGCKSGGRSTPGDANNTDFIRNGDTSTNSNVGCKSGGRSTPGDAINADFIRKNDTSSNSYLGSSDRNTLGNSINADFMRNGDMFADPTSTHPENENSSDADEPDGSANRSSSSIKLGRVSSTKTREISHNSYKHPELNPNSSSTSPLQTADNSVKISCRRNGGDSDGSKHFTLDLSVDGHTTVSSVFCGEEEEDGKTIAKVDSENDLEVSTNTEAFETASTGQIEREDFGEWSTKRTRSGSWAQELEQYRVSETGLLQNKTGENDWSDCEDLSRYLQTDLDCSAQDIEAMSQSQVRSLIAEMQKRLANATVLNLELRKQVEEGNGIVDEQQARDHDAGTDPSDDKDDLKSNSHAPAQRRRSQIPRPLGNTSANDTTANSESRSVNGAETQLEVSSRSVGEGLRDSTHRSFLGNLEGQDIVSTKAASGIPTDDTIVNFMESFQIQKLEEELCASKQSVRHLTKMNEMYLSAMEAAGVSLAHLGGAGGEGGTEMSLNGLIPGQNNGHEGIHGMIASNKDKNRSCVASETCESKERVRFDHSGLYPFSVTQTGLATPTVSEESVYMRSRAGAVPARSTDKGDGYSSAVNHPNSSAHFNHLEKTNDCIDLKHNDQSSSLALRNTDTTSSLNTNSSAEVSQHLDNTTNNLPSKNFSAGSTNQLPNLYQDSSEEQISPRKSGNLSPRPNGSRLAMDASVLDQSGYPDVTYSSMLDNTVVSRLLANLESNMSTIREDALNASCLNLEQLQIRVEHLERVNLTLREEIGVYEALHQSQSTQVSPCIGQEFGGSVGGLERGMTDDDLLKQHLIEIRKLRHRLERLDITKDPEQLLIFQSHTQQRIVRQETMISHLQQQLVEKEDHWQRALAELQHRLSREKALLVEKLELAICELQKELRSQSSKIEEQERHINDLNSELSLKEEYEIQKDDELKKVLHEKSELETDLLKRDKEFLDIEKSLFKVEMAKENIQSECKKLYIEIEEKDKEVEIVRHQIEGFKENSRSLKETIVKCEKSVQEKVFIIQKLSSEKVGCENRLGEREGQVKRLESEIGALRKEMRSEVEEKTRLEAEVNSLREELKSKENLKTKYEFQKVGYESEIERITQEKTKLVTQVESRANEKIELKQKIDDLEQRLLRKSALENQIYILKEEIKSLARLQDKVDDLKCELESKNSVETELRDRLKTMGHLQSEVEDLRARLFKAEDSGRQVEDGKNKAVCDLREKEEKLKKRDKQLNHLLAQYKKLDSAFTRQRYMLNEKLELVQSLKKQMHLYEVTLTCASQEEKDSIMKQLLRELIATQRQVDDLLSRLEQNSAALKAPVVFLDGFNMTSSTTTTTATTNNRHDLSDVTVSSAARDDFIDVNIGQTDGLFDTLNEDEYHLNQEPHSSSALNPISVNHLSPSRPHLSSHGTPSNPSPHRSHLSSHVTSPNNSPRHLKYYSDSDCAVPKGIIPQGLIGSDIRNLFAVLKLESHEKLRKETGECLVTLSGIEARLGSRLRMYKAKSVSESLDYSTLRETSMSCQNLRVCLEEASRLIATAWVTELPPIDSQGHFYDPILAEQNENLKQQLKELSSCSSSMLDPHLKEPHLRSLNTTNENSKLWETSLYKQLHKTTRDLEQAKENIDTSLAELPSPRRYQSFNNYSQHKSPRRRLEDTL